MSFELSAQSKDGTSIERPASQLIQTVQNAEPNRGATSETAATRNVFFGGAGKWKRSAFRPFEKQVGRFGNDRFQAFALGRARQSDKIINPQRDAKTIEAGAEIGSAGRNADGNLLPHRGEGRGDCTYSAKRKNEQERLAR